MFAKAQRESLSPCFLDELSRIGESAMEDASAVGSGSSTLLQNIGIVAPNSLFVVVTMTSEAAV